MAQDLRQFRLAELAGSPCAAGEGGQPYFFWLGLHLSWSTFPAESLPDLLNGPASIVKAAPTSASAAFFRRGCVRVRRAQPAAPIN